MKARDQQEQEQSKVQRYIFPVLSSSMWNECSTKPQLPVGYPQSPGYLRHHLEKVSDDEQILKLESEVASLNPASVKSSRSSSSVRRNSSADPSHRRPQPAAEDQDKSHQRSQSAGRASRVSGNGGRANVQQVGVFQTFA